MSAARLLAAEGHLAQAAGIYQTLVLTNTPEAGNAAAAIKALLDGPCKQEPLQESIGVVAAAGQIARRGRGIATAEVVEQATKFVADRGDADPRAGVAILDSIRPLVIDTRPLDARRLALLRKWAASDPNDLDAIGPLASILEQQGHAAEAKKLLLPLKDKLGDGEGARALGMILGHEGDYDGAYALLWPYVKPHLDKLHAAEEASESAGKQL